MSEYDRDGAQLREEERQHDAAAKIQRRWRDYAKTFLAPGLNASGADDGADGTGAGGGARELTEEEQRERLLEQCRQLLQDRDNLLLSNANYQRALSKLFAERRAAQGQDTNDPTAGGGAGGGGQPVTADAEAKYWAQVQRIRDERAAVEAAKQQGVADVAAAKERNAHILQEAMQYEHNFREFVKEKAREAVFSATHRPLPPKRIEEFDAEEDALYAQVHEARVQYIRLRNRSRKLARDMSDKDRKKDGMHLIDFEQLKIENTNLNEKIEERNEDLLKLRKKATTTIHVLTHVKEKLEFVKGENAQLQRQVAALEEQLGALRDKLAQVKRERDAFVNDNLKMREKMPMIGSEDLLLDFEVRKKEIENCRVEIVDLTNKHHELMQWIRSHQPMLETLQRTAA